MAKRRNILRLVQAGLVHMVNLAAATQAVTQKQTNETFVGVVDAIFTLPTAADVDTGTIYHFVTGVASGGSGLTVTPASADFIAGGGLTATDGESIQNSGGTDVLGDQVSLMSDGTNWLVTNLIGTWAKV